MTVTERFTVALFTNVVAQRLQYWGYKTYTSSFVPYCLYPLLGEFGSIPPSRCRAFHCFQAQSPCEVYRNISEAVACENGEFISKYCKLAVDVMCICPLPFSLMACALHLDSLFYLWPSVCSVTKYLLLVFHAVSCLLYF